MILLEVNIIRSELLCCAQWPYADATRRVSAHSSLTSLLINLYRDWHYSRSSSTSVASRHSVMAMSSSIRFFEFYTMSNLGFTYGVRFINVF